MTEALAWGIIGIAPTHDLEVVKQAWRKKATLLHPDHGGSAAGFVQLKTAFDFICAALACGSHQLPARQVFGITGPASPALVFTPRNPWYEAEQEILERNFRHHGAYSRRGVLKR